MSTLFLATFVLAHPSPASTKRKPKETNPGHPEIAASEDTSTAEGVADEAMPSNLALELFSGPNEEPLALILANLDPSDLYAFWMSHPNITLPREFFATTTITIRDDLEAESVTRMLPFLQQFRTIQVSVNPDHIAVLVLCPDLRHLEVRSESAVSFDVFLESMGALDGVADQNRRLTNLTITIPEYRSLSSWLGFASIFRLLLRNEDADPAAGDNEAIRWAATRTRGPFAVFQALLQDERVDPTANDNAVIRLASEYGNHAVVQALLQDGRVDPAADDNAAIRYASEYDRLAVVQALLQDERVDPTADDNYAIQIASERGHLDIVQALLQDARVDPAAVDSDAIRVASQNGHVSVVQLLLQDARADPAARNNEAIRMASKAGHLAVVQALLQDDRVDPTADGNEAMRFARDNGHEQIVQLLQQHEEQPAN